MWVLLKNRQSEIADYHYKRFYNSWYVYTVYRLVCHVLSQPTKITYQNK